MVTNIIGGILCNQSSPPFNDCSVAIEELNQRQFPGIYSPLQKFLQYPRVQSKAISPQGLKTMNASIGIISMIVVVIAYPINDIRAGVCIREGHQGTLVRIVRCWVLLRGPTKCW